MFNKQNKTSLSENWNEYRNAQSVIALDFVSWYYSSERYDTRSNFQTTMHY